MKFDTPDLSTATRSVGLGMLFHACYPEPPEQLGKGLHNITPIQLHDLLMQLQKIFRFVSVDEFAAAREQHGLACVSFDDGYKSVFEQALPVLQTLGIPSTVFVNSAMLDGKVFWRDRVRVLQNLGLVEDFEVFSAVAAGDPAHSFYRRSKHPAVNSAAVDHALRQYFADRSIPGAESQAVIDGIKWLRPLPGISYGNHSHSHYVLSSLNEEQQYQEIARCQERLESVPGIRLSETFSIPFGELRDFNTSTLSAITELGYRSIALSRHRLQDHNHSMGGLQVVERFMPKKGVRALFSGFPPSRE